MTQRGLHIIKPGVLSLIQDLGRHHYQHLGLTTGGAADEQAFCWANRLLNNAPNSPALEICYGGLQLIAQTPCVIAITGADCQVTINDQQVENWQTHWLNTGDLLRFGHPQFGIRTYLAVVGGFTVTPTLGSVATVIREKFGGLDGFGSPLQAGDILPCHESDNIARRQVAPDFIPNYQAPLTLRMIKNPQKKLFREQALFDLTAVQ
ncbi:MAG: allophanate hydrolase, partial [Methylophaga sp.]|nr:allophanate hydrolase [Methylophaga sp.]